MLSPKNAGRLITNLKVCMEKRYGGFSPSGMPVLPRMLPPAEAGSPSGRWQSPRESGDIRSPSLPSVAASPAGAADATSCGPAAPVAVSGACAEVEGLSQIPRATKVSKAAANPRRCGGWAGGAGAGVASSPLGRGACTPRSRL